MNLFIMDRSQSYVEFKHGHEFLYHSKMYDALFQGIKQDDFILRLEDDFHV